MSDIRNNFIDSIGNTPLIKLKRASEITGCNIYGKADQKIEYNKDYKNKYLLD